MSSRKDYQKRLKRNYQCRFGEIDIIAKDGEYTCFVEVRLRKTNNFGSPADTIDKRKQQKIIKTAQTYAVQNGIYDTPMRFDAVLINAETDGEKLVNEEIQIIKNAFTL